MHQIQANASTRPHPFLHTEPVAIVGMGGLFPGAPDLQTFWDNIQAGCSSARPVPDERWTLPPGRVYRPGIALDHVYSRHACLLDSFVCDPRGLAIDPDLLSQLDPLYHLVLHVGRQAWQDAETRAVDRRRVGVILGNIALPTNAVSEWSDRMLGPTFAKALSEKLGRTLRWHQSGNGCHPLNRFVAGMPGSLLAQALSLGAGAHTLDAACASSLYALKYACDQLQSGHADAMLAGGVSRPDCLYTQMGFSQLHALSASGKCSPFDQQADGLVVGEGAGIVLLKRLSDALNAGDHIYALIRGIGLSNDIGGNLMLPDTPGQLRAMRAAYRQANWNPATVDLIECHGTGTPIGDAVEFQSLCNLWRDQSSSIARKQPCVMGSVKSNVGHLLTGAGAAGLIKTLLAMKHRTLPPNANVTRSHSKLKMEASPFQILKQAQPWQSRDPGGTYRAAVSAFGFGGINAHVLLESFEPDAYDASRDEPLAASVLLTSKPVPATADESVEPQVRDQTASKEIADASTPVIAVVGLAGHFGPWQNLETLAQRLLGDDRTPPARPTRWWGVPCENRRGYFIDEVAIPLGRFRIPPTELKQMLPQQLLMLQTAANALADAGLEASSRQPASRTVSSHGRLTTGVFIGIGLDPNTTNFHFRWEVENQARRWANQLNLNPDDRQFEKWVADLRQAAGPGLTADRTMGALGGIVASRIARAFDVGGPGFTISSEQTSALYALKQAAGALQRGELDVAIVGAVEMAGDPRLALAPDAGPITCDGAGAMILKRLDDARRDGDRVWATIAGIGVSTVSADNALAHAEAEAEAQGVDETSGHRFDAKPRLGEAGAAMGMADLIQACLALHHEILEDRYWLHDRAQGPRLAHVQRQSVGDNHVAVLLRQADVSQQAINPAMEYPHVSQPLVVSEPIGPEGKIAFVFPGAGNAFADMGRDLARTFVGPLRRLHRENQLLKSQFAYGQFWDRTPLEQISHKDMIFGQVWLGCMVSDIMQLVGVDPQAIIGYSLGETTGLFATRSWTDRDEMFRRINESSLFTRDLAGSYDAVRQAWRRPGDQPVDWQVAVVRCAADRVREVLEQEEANCVYLLIINTPEECVIGGDGAQLQKILELLQVPFHPVQGVTSVHCAAAHPVKQAWRELHQLPTTPPRDITFYSGTTGQAYVPTMDSAADSILGHAMETLDFSKVIRNAYDEGVRCFLEMGPGSSCTRMIRQILGDRPHLALSACPANQNAVQAIDHILQTLKAHQFPVTASIPPLRPYLSQQASRDVSFDVATEAKQVIRVRVGHPPFEIQTDVPGPSVSAISREEAISGTETRKPVVSVEPVATLTPTPPAFATEPTAMTTHGSGVATLSTTSQKLVQQTIAAQMAHSRAQQAFMQLSQNVTSSLGEAIGWQMRLQAVSASSSASDSSSSSSSSSSAIASDENRAVAGKRVTPVLDRQQCMAFAVGKVGQVLGEAFAPVDAFPTRVRLPDEPLMLVDRILEIQGEPLSLTHGKVVTEHDIHPDAWYLDAGRIPTCIAVEAGQADLFLSGYLGIDFQTRGRAVYRLLDAVVTFHAPLPRGGQTIRYDIYIDEFFRQDKTYLFRFHFDATVNGQPFLTMSNGCAGFFTMDQLNAGKGIVQTRMDRQPMSGKKSADWIDLTPPAETPEAYDETQLEALRQGDLARCFGPTFEGLALNHPAGLPAGRMTLVHRILELQTDAGRFGIGKIVGEADIHPDDWFLTCHFIDDQVMPGTLMYECCLHTLRVFLLRLGWVGEAAQFVYEPIPEVAGQLRCRGQVLATTRKVRYELTVKELGYTASDQTPYVLADALMYADGKPVVQMKNMSLRLAGLTRDQLLDLWKSSRQTRPVSPSVSRANKKTIQATKNTSARQVAPRTFGRPAIFGPDQMLAFTEGKPSEAFGSRYEIFDDQRRIARLPRAPYAFLDRIVAIDNCEPWVLKAGAVIEGEYDVPADAWYFSANRQPTMPFAILLEIALQPCGWLAAYLGSALTSETDLSFRNLGGTATQHQPVTPDIGTLATRIKMTQVSRSGGMIIQHYDMHMTSVRGDIYAGSTYFGFFSAESLANQVGIPNAKLYAPTDQHHDQEPTAPTLHTGMDAIPLPGSYPTQPPFPDHRMRMIDQIDAFDPTGGPAGLGFIQGSLKVDPDAWFFQAHFYQDPVCPGSLGLESFIQLVEVMAASRWKVNSQTRFLALSPGCEHRWVYRGQVVPTDGRVIVQAVVKSVHDAEKTLAADGFLTVDGRIIYQMLDFVITMV